MREVDDGQASQLADRWIDNNMAPTENIDLDCSYEPAPKSPREEPLFSSKVQTNEIALTPELFQELIDKAWARDMLRDDLNARLWRDGAPQPDPPLYCSTCGVILVPHEVTLDLGDGPELLCDRCLGLTN